MNIELLEEIRDFVVKHPRNVDMSLIEQETESCGTVACIAGWALILSGDSLKNHPSWGINPSWDWELHAARLLKVDITETDRLFFVQRWPDDLRRRLIRASGQEYANIVAERIDRYIKGY